MSKSTAAAASKTFNSGSFSIVVTPETTLAPSEIRKAVKAHGLTGGDASKAVRDFLSFQRTNFGDALAARNSEYGKLLTLASGKDWVAKGTLASNGKSLTIRADYTGSGSISPRTVSEITRALETLNAQS